MTSTTIYIYAPDTGNIPVSVPSTATDQQQLVLALAAQTAARGAKP